MIPLFKVYTTHVHHQSIASSHCVDVNGWMSMGWCEVGARSSGFIYFLPREYF